MRYRIITKIKKGEIQYMVQSNFLFGFPFFWRTVTYIGYLPPHPDLTIPANCIVNCVFSNSNDAEKCLIALSGSKNKI